MSFKKGILFTVVFWIEVLILVGCNTVSDASNDQLQNTDISEPTTRSKATSVSTDHILTTATILQPTKTQTDPYFRLCESVPEPLLNHPPSNTGEEFLSGKFYLCSMPAFSAFDFDEGKVLDKEVIEADLRLEVGKATFDNHVIYYLREENTSLVDEIDTSNPTYSECKELISSPSRLGYIIGAQSNSGCIQTNQGRLGFFKVTKMDPKGIESIELSFILWNKND
jgi:hypothetical protein